MTKNSLTKSEVPVDRRIQRTKKLLLEALMHLIVERGYEAVTIQDIIDQANVGRSTFYSHYENKEQLLFSANQVLLTHLSKKDPAKRETISDKIALVYKYAKSHPIVIKALLSVQGSPILQQAENIFRRIVEAEMARTLKPKSSKIFYEINVESATAGLVRMLVTWLNADMPITEEKMAELSCEFLEALLLKKTEG